MQVSSRQAASSNSHISKSDCSNTAMHLHVCSAPFGEELRQHLEGQQAQHHEPMAQGARIDTLTHLTLEKREHMFFLSPGRHGISHSLLQKPGKSFSWRTHLSRSSCHGCQVLKSSIWSVRCLYEFQLEE